MPRGWIRAYAAEADEIGGSFFTSAEREAHARFRAGFRTPFLLTADDSSEVQAELSWGDVVELPDGLSSTPWTAALFQEKPGFIKSDHVVEIAYVGRRGTTDKDLKAQLRHGETNKTIRELLWGDCVQILAKGDKTSTVRARGKTGTIGNEYLTQDSLLEVYFIDVGQGDGVLVRTPDGRHLLVDGGLERKKQITGKSAADFVDWKFFKDYGDHRIRLESMVVSHSDNDHYGGMQDLVRETRSADRELDCDGVDIAVLHHPGVSRWEKRTDTEPPHADGLGPKTQDGFFVRLLEDRADAEAALVNGAEHEFTRDWKSFFRDILDNSEETAVERVGVTHETLRDGGILPEIWHARAGCSIKVLGPVTVDINGRPAVKDLGDKGVNTNGHSVCLRIDYGKARVLLTGDLNKKSMDWLRDCYGDRIAAFRCDVAKACHHGSHKISYRFLEAMRPSATIISSGDAEGHAHPRPEIVGASAITGYVSVDRERDILLTPLIYMTEIERSVSLGAVNRIDFKGVPTDEGTMEGTLPGRHLDELTERVRFTSEEHNAMDAAGSGKSELKKQLEARLRELETKMTEGSLKAEYSYTVPQGPMNPRHEQRKVWRSRIMHKNHYGLVNVRTDGELIMCATIDETEKDWIVHAFPARFPHARIPE